MAANIARAGHPLRVWNRTRTNAKPLGAEGATVCDTPSDATDGAGIVVTMLADGPATAATVEGALREGQVWAQMGTVGVEWTERLAALAAEAGVPLVDAPVLGSRPAAESGTLIVVASGPDEVIDRAQTVFEAVGRETMLLGHAGNGTRTKLVFNYWVLAQTAVTAEVVALADALGTGGARILELIGGGFADAPYAQMKGAKMVAGDWEPMFGSAEGLELTVAAAVVEDMDRAIARGYGDSDTAAVIAATRPGKA